MSSTNKETNLEKLQITALVTREVREIIRAVCVKRKRSMAQQIAVLFTEEKARIDREERFGIIGEKK